MHAAAAVIRAWLDCTAPVVITHVAPCSRASPIRNSSLRALLPPRASPVRSSRFNRMRGHRAGPPSASRSPAASVSGVGSTASLTRGNRSNAERETERVTADSLPRILHEDRLDLAHSPRKPSSAPIFSSSCALRVFVSSWLHFPAGRLRQGLVYNRGREFVDLMDEASVRNFSSATAAVCVPGVLAVLGVLGASAQDSTRTPYRTLNDRFAPPHYATLADWQPRASYLREHVLASAGLVPFPDRTPLRPHVFGKVRRREYSVFKVYFESLPGFYVTGNLYRPEGTGPFPAILSPHGHWPYGRLENTDIMSGPGRAINLARQGFMVFTYDMIGFNDSRQLTHEFGGQREKLWGLSLSGLQLWNSIRSIDFLESLPDVDRNRIGATGESGGGTQTFLLAAVDARIKVAAPVNMISLHMQGGCLCENLPGLRLETTNVEIAATIAPRPLLMISATGDWTAETLEREYPAVRAIYELFGAADHVRAVRMTAEHNYNKDSREAMYAWMARWLQHAPPDV